MKHRRVFRIILAQSPPGCSESFDLDRSIAAIARRHGFVGNYGHTATAGATDDDVPDGVTAVAFEEVIQLGLGSARMKLSPQISIRCLMRESMDTHVTDEEYPCPVITDSGCVSQLHLGSYRNCQLCLREGLRQPLGFGDWWNLREAVSVAESRRKLFSVPAAEWDLLPAESRE